MKRSAKLRMRHPIIGRRPKWTPWGALRRPMGECLSIQILDESTTTWPFVSINAMAHGKVRALVQTCPHEVTWLSPVTVQSDGNVLITDVFVPEQECNSCYTRVTRDGESALISDLVTQRNFTTVKSLICWGHSHAVGSVYASNEDEACTRDFLKSMREMGKTHFVRLVVNKWDDLFASLYSLDEKRAYHHVPLRVEPPETDRWRAWAKKEVRDKVIRIPEPELEDFDDVMWFWQRR